MNDTRGHQVGDLVLAQVAERLRRAVRVGDTVARRGGDEFAAILPDADPAGALAAAERMLTEPILVGGSRVSVGASIGVALWPTHGEGADALLRRADAAMYAAKQGGGGSRLAGAPAAGAGAPVIVGGLA